MSCEADIPDYVSGRSFGAQADFATPKPETPPVVPEVVLSTKDMQTSELAPIETNEMGLQTFEPYPEKEEPPKAVEKNEMEIQTLPEMYHCSTQTPHKSRKRGTS